MSAFIWSGDINERFIYKLLSSPDSHNLVLCSRGGYVDEMMAAIDFLQSDEWAVTGTGAIMSAAVPIVACGKIRRCSKLTRWMVHPPREFNFTDRTADDLERDKKELERCEKVYWEILGATTKKSAAWWKKKSCGTEYYFGAEEALAFGLIDEVI